MPSIRQIQRAKLNYNLRVSDCEAVYANGGMQYVDDYYIMVRPDGARTPFKAACKVINGAGEGNVFVLSYYLVPRTYEHI